MRKIQKENLFEPVLLEEYCLSALNLQDQIEIDGGVDEATESVLDWCGRMGGHIANGLESAWNFYKKGVLEHAAQEKSLF